MLIRWATLIYFFSHVLMEKIYLVDREDQIDDEINKDLVVLKQDIEWHEDIPIKDIQNFIAAHKWSPEELINGIYKMVSNSKEFRASIRNHKKHIEKSELLYNNQLYAQLFYYFFDRWYVFTDVLKLTSYQKKEFLYTDYPELGQLFGKEFQWRWEYYIINDPNSTDKWITIIDKAIVNSAAKDGLTKKIIINELTHATIFTELYMTQGSDKLLPQLAVEALSDVVSSLSDINYFKYILRLSLMYNISPQWAIDAVVVERYWFSYQIILGVFEVVFNKIYSTTLQSDLMPYIDKIGPIPVVKTLEYKTFIDSIMKNYDSVIENHKQEIDVELLNVGTNLIKEYQQLSQKK